MPKLMQPPKTGLFKAKTKEPEVIYPVKRVDMCYSGEGGVGPITCSQAKQMLGWETEEEYALRICEGLGEKEAEKAKAKAKFGDDYLLTDQLGQKVRCHLNDHNRPFTDAWARTLAQDILNGNWRFNMENIIIGKYGHVLSGQHRLVGLVLAGQIWADEKYRYHWEELWPEEPVIESCVAFGADETQEYTRTLDNVKPRTLTDVVYSMGLFKDKKLKTTDQVKLSKMLDHAVRFLWHRTGASANAFAPRRTHSESLDFIERHKKLLSAVRHIYEEYIADWQGRGKLFSPGYASGLLYLMGSSSSDLDIYRNADPPSEKQLKWDNWERACEFWTIVHQIDNNNLKAVREAIGYLQDADTLRGGTWQEKTAIVVKAWKLFVQKYDVTRKDLKLSYEKDGDGKPIRLDECPTVGGIDIGDPDALEVDSDAPAAEAEAEQEAIDETSEEDSTSNNGEQVKDKSPSKSGKKPTTVRVPQDRVIKSDGPDYEEGNGKEPRKPPVPKLTKPLNKGDRGRDQTPGTESTNPQADRGGEYP